MSDNLWKPLPMDSSAINRGNRKVALHWLKKEKGAKEQDCIFCGKRVLILEDKSMLTLNGSSHSCVQSKEVKIDTHESD